jgi:hypothetical protein
VLAGGSRVERGWSEGTGVQRHTAHASEWWCVVRSGPPCGGKAGERQSGGAAPRAAACGGAAPRAAACGGAAPRAAAPAGYGPRPMLVTGPAVARPNGPAQGPGPALLQEIRDGLEGDGLVSPGCLRCGPLPFADCRPSALSRGCGSRLAAPPQGAPCVRTQFPLYAAAPLSASSARVRDGSARSAPRHASLTGREAGPRTRG